MLRRLEVADQGLQVLHLEPARAPQLVDPVPLPVDRAFPAERGPAVAARGVVGVLADAVERDDSTARPTSEVAARGVAGGRGGREPSVARDALLAAGAGDEAIGPLGRDPPRRGLVEQDVPRPRVERRQALQRERDGPAEVLLGVAGERAVIACATFALTEVRLGVRDDLQPRRLLGRDARLAHPALALGVGPRGDLGRVGVAGQAEGVVQVALADEIQRRADLAAGDGVERVLDGLAWLGLDRGLGLRRDRLDQLREVVGREMQRQCAVAEEVAVADRQPPLGRAEADEPLQLVELPAAFRVGLGRALGVVGGAGRRVAEQSAADLGDLVVIGLVRVLVLGIPRPRRPLVPAPLQRGLDRRPVGRGVDAEHRVVVGDHGAGGGPQGASRQGHGGAMPHSHYRRTVVCLHRPAHIPSLPRGSGGIQPRPNQADAASRRRASTSSSVGASPSRATETTPTTAPSSPTIGTATERSAPKARSQ